MHDASNTPSERLEFFRRKILKISQGKMAEKVGLSQSAYSRVETGDNAISERLINVLSKEYRMSIDWLLTGDGQPIRAEVGSSIVSEPAAAYTPADDLAAFRRLTDVLIAVRNRLDASESEP